MHKFFLLGLLFLQQSQPQPSNWYQNTETPLNGPKIMTTIIEPDIECSGGKFDAKKNMCRIDIVFRQVNKLECTSPYDLPGSALPYRKIISCWWVDQPLDK